MEIRGGIYEYAKEYYKQHKNLLIIDNTKKEDVVLMGHLKNLRKCYMDGNLNQETINAYNKIGMVWDEAELKTAQWNFCYQLAKQYHESFGSLIMPRAFEIKGIKLAAWLEEQKEHHKKGTLSQNRAKKLESIGMEWTEHSYNKVSFSEKAVAYYIEKRFPDVITSYRPHELHGRELDIYIPSKDIGIEYDGSFYHKNKEKDESKNKLCKRAKIKLYRIRECGCPILEDDGNCTVIRKSNNNSMSSLSRVIIALLKQIDPEYKADIDVNRDKKEIFGEMVDKITYFNQYFMAAEHYYVENGHLLVPKNYTDPTGIRLGKWIESIRNSKDMLSERQQNALDDLDMVWENVEKEKWLYNFNLATAQDTIPFGAKTTDGKDLQKWYEKQETRFVCREFGDDYREQAFQRRKRQQETTREKRREDNKER